MYNLIAPAAVRQAHRTKLLDIKAGFDLFRSRQVPTSLKVGAILIGVLATAALAFLEIPLEGLVALLLPFVGPAIDLAVDGAEIILFPFLMGAAILPHLVNWRLNRRA